MSDADEMTHDYAAAEMVADVMVAAVDIDQVAADGESDSDRHDGEMTTICSDDGDGVAEALFDSNNIESNCMDSHTYSKLHHDLVLCQKARCMNSMISTPIKQSRSFSYLFLFIMY